MTRSPWYYPLSIATTAWTNQVASKPALPWKLTDLNSSTCLVFRFQIRALSAITKDRRDRKNPSLAVVTAERRRRRKCCCSPGRQQKEEDSHVSTPTSPFSRYTATSKNGFAFGAGSERHTRTHLTFKFWTDQSSPTRQRARRRHAVRKIRGGRQRVFVNRVRDF